MWEFVVLLEETCQILVYISRLNVEKICLMLKMKYKCNIAITYLTKSGDILRIR